VAAARHDPQARLRNRLGHFHRQLDRIQGIAIALNNQGAGADRREMRWSKGHVVVAIGKRFGAGENRVDLSVSARMAPPQDLPLLFGKAVAILAHDGTCLRGVVRSRAHQHHGVDALRLHGGHVQ